MSLKRKDKELIIKKLFEVANNALSCIIAKYSGISSVNMNLLRKEGNKKNIYLQVVQNNLAKLAIKKTKFNINEELFIGPVILIFSLDNHEDGAKLLYNFSKKCNQIIVKKIFIFEKILGPENLEFIANLPKYEEILVKTGYIMKLPIVKMLKTLQEPYIKFIATLVAITKNLNCLGEIK